MRQRLSPEEQPTVLLFDVIVCKCYIVSQPGMAPLASAVVQVEMVEVGVSVYGSKNYTKALDDHGGSSLHTPVTSPTLAVHIPIEVRDLCFRVRKQRSVLSVILSHSKYFDGG